MSPSLDPTLYGIKLTTWVTILEYGIPIISVLLILGVRIIRNPKAKRFISTLLPFFSSDKPIDFLVKVDAHPLVEFCRAKNKLSIVFTDKMLVTDSHALLSLMIEGVQYSKDKFYYIHELDLSRTSLIDDRALSIIRDVVDHVVRNNGICLDVVLPDLGSETKFPKLYAAISKTIPDNRGDIRILIKTDGSNGGKSLLLDSGK